MVAPFRRAVEWNLLPRSHGTSTDLAAGIGCLGNVGLWRVARLPLVSGAVEPACGGFADNGEGADPHCDGLHGLGATVAQSLRAMPLRQPSSGSNSVFAHLQGQPLHALAACTGLY